MNMLQVKHYHASVLLIDEDPQSTIFLQSVPERTMADHFDIAHAGTLRDAKQHLGAQAVDIILLDLYLPDSSGLDTLRALIQLQLNIPIVIYSHRENLELAMETMREGADDFLSKSNIDERTLVRTLRFTLERHQLQSDLQSKVDKLSSGRHRLRHMLENLADAILVISDEGKIQFVNQAAEALFHRNRDELIGQHFGFPVIYDAMIEINIVAPNLSITFAEMRAVKFELEDSPCVVASLRDISELRNSYAALQESSGRIRGIFENVNNGIVTIDERGIVKTINPAAELMFGYTALEIIGKNVSRLVGGADSDKHDAWISAYIDSGERKIIGKKSRELSGLRKSGENFPIELSVSEMQLGEIREFVGVIVDITDRKETQNQLFQSQKMEAVGQLTGGIAHDFNNILGVVLGNMELLYESLPDDEEIKAYVDRAMEAIMLGAGLTKQLLAFSRRQELEPKVLDVNKLVMEMDKMLRLTLGEAVEIKTELGDNIDLIKADPSQLESMILNLSINSRDAMNGIGHLLIETSNEDLDSDYVELHPYANTGPHVCISVTDTGTGMPEDVLAKIFQPFFTTKAEGKGTGLGLSMVFGFVKQSGGHIDVSSEMGYGTRIRIYLPACDEVGAAIDSEKNELWSPHLGRGKTVLLVEDEKLLRETTTLMLKEQGYTVLSADDGPSALELLLDSPRVDLLFTDMVLPGGITGHELALKVLEFLPELPVLLSSGYSRDTIRGGRLFSFLQKPYTDQELYLAIGELLDTKGKRGIEHVQVS